MDDYTDKIKTQIETIEGSISNVLSFVQDEDNGDDNTLDIFERIELVVNLTNDLLSKAIPSFIPTANLDKINKSIVALNNNCISYNNSKNIAYLNNCNTEIDSLLGHIGCFNIGSSKDVVKQTLGQVIGVYKRQRDDIIRNYEEQKEILKEEVATISAKNSELEANIKAQETSMQSIISTFQTQFSNAQEARMTEFAKLLKESSDTFDDKDSELDEQTKSILENMNKNNKKAEELLQLAGAIATTGNYKKYADEAKKNADRLFWVAFGFMVFAALLVGGPILYSIIQNVKIEWLELLYRVPIIVTLLLPAFYAANESKKQRDNEFKNRKFQVEIAAIDPYLSDIKDTENGEISNRSQAKLELVKSFFGKEFKSSDDSSVSIPKDVLTFVKEVLKLIK